MRKCAGLRGQKAEDGPRENKAVQPPSNKAMEPGEPPKAVHMGGGWYLLPTGEKVQGANAVIEAGFTV